ncbi:hypothetical protein LNP04_11710 [Chryseobacterium sp. C-71]|uniref:hypothetical protein n=1 Tax=Chryseobacterium sp. C-71 TaxID=2893882 RepID=UPI001E2C14B1|nr:hypothetical protein [Chryseobacterium sp. C-71]UFH30641.1 hypothetical protein LNP04_11710 [Chryseobacterium sp. C-71]
MKNSIAENFVMQTKQLYNLGIELNPNDEIAEEVLKEALIIKPKESEYLYNENPILDLIKNYHTETFDIGMIHFYDDKKLQSYEDYIIVGSDGAGEFISIQKSTDKIYLLDGYFEQILFCCESAEIFLNNLIKIGEANIIKLSTDEKYRLAKSMSSNDENLGFYLDSLGATQ